VRALGGGPAGPAAGATAPRPVPVRGKLFHGWVVVGAGFLIGFVGIGSRYSYGIFLKSIEAEFAMSRGAASGVFSAYMLLCCVLAAVGGWALDRYGPKRVGILLGTFTGLSLVLTSQARAPWQLFLTYSLLLALGTGPIYGVVNTTASRWFLQRRGVAVGITSSGGGVGAIAIAPFATFLIAHYSWRTAFAVMGVLAAVAMIGSALLLIKDPRDAGHLPDGVSRAPGPASSRPPTGAGAEGLTLRRALVERSFWLLVASWFLLSLSLHMVFIHVVPYAVGMGVSPIDASLILSVMGLANILGRLAVGRLSDLIGPRALGVVCPLVQCGALLWLLGSDQLWMLYVFGAAFGFLWGGTGTITTVLTVDLFGTRSLGTIMGLMSGGWAVGAAVGPAIGGFVFDATGHYLAAFGAGAAALLTAAGLLAVLGRGGQPRERGVLK